LAPNGVFRYILNHVTVTVTVMRIHPEQGTLEFVLCIGYSTHVGTSNLFVQGNTTQAMSATPNQGRDPPLFTNMCMLSCVQVC
jgi:hypothetical protein